MTFPFIIDHAARLLNIILKSPQPADSLASQYFRKKKSIGSKERKYLSESVFATLRNKALCEYLSDEVTLRLLDEDILTNDHFSDKTLKTMSVYCSCTAISYFLPLEEKLFDPENLAAKIIKSGENKFLLIFSDALALNFSIPIELARKYIELVYSIFRELDDGAELIRAKNVLSEEDITLLSVRYSIPEWIIKSWSGNSNSDLNTCDIMDLARSLNFPAKFTIRSNEALVDRNKVLSELDGMDIIAHKGRLSPSALLISKRTLLTDKDLYKKGLVEVQDEGSQLISYAIGPDPKWRILDACAGAGGKTLHLAALQKDKGSILASDIEFRRLREISRRAERAGFRSISTFLIKGNIKSVKKSNHDKYFSRQYNAVLIDAPCSGLGTARRMPMQKWKLNPKLLERHNRKQYSILEDYSNYVTPDGILVYATCSIMAEENGFIVKRFLDKHPDFIPDPLFNAFNKYGINIPGLGSDDHMLTLYPSKHGCDGFFMARMKRVSV